jgi:two-component system OmpR family response regulator
MSPGFAATLTMGLRAEGFVVVHADNGVDGLWEATENNLGLPVHH